MRETTKIILTRRHRTTEQQRRDNFFDAARVKDKDHEAKVNGKNLFFGLKTQVLACEFDPSRVRFQGFHRDKLVLFLILTIKIQVLSVPSEYSVDAQI